VLVLAIPANSAPRQNGQNGKSVEQTCRNQSAKKKPKARAAVAPSCKRNASVIAP
jgi:hypothetical protein